ncbi:hypothetical protein AXG93_2891s1070 [Marchantia polymorpha subsp. ruderalis]|uniref:Uncharacterized protein n=1 Tax=Marchantia polymorpha subsp. ruderalis TaxID=1480154 RepID=A0A176WMI8_MARPO|nr:hypothetical protein AXG93_2891s1070 [Marchantia polymorpha subsp. ruderalis]
MMMAGGGERGRPISVEIEESKHYDVWALNGYIFVQSIDSASKLGLRDRSQDTVIHDLVVLPELDDGAPVPPNASKMPRAAPPAAVFVSCEGGIRFLLEDKDIHGRLEESRASIDGEIQFSSGQVRAGARLQIRRASGRRRRQPGEGGAGSYNFASSVRELDRFDATGGGWELGAGRTPIAYAYGLYRAEREVPVTGRKYTTPEMLSPKCAGLRQQSA